ncbi:hypothetical protein Phum_PHUM463030 [Pediculus humanus corporis]|uniref:Uncharacterized protein n=1 Tax=Pediculus humanus subsp. corporis TaxID=121224 RepID=E0VVF9_PEDHC|nr:uncharacterized protein Phum_PHUM463030 [Pediculus humanus corporis]EEB17365.1 hypothetical protein Phum_PHUM463030 [Pediculus humanus corporis]
MKLRSFLVSLSLSVLCAYCSRRFHGDGVLVIRNIATVRLPLHFFYVFPLSLHIARVKRVFM